VEHLLVVLHLVGVLEEVAHHPGVGQDDVEAFHGVVGAHGLTSGGRSADGDGFGAGDSLSSFEYSTNAAPMLTRRMPTQSSGCGISMSKWNGSPFFGCQTALTRTLITGARPKISGAM